MIPKRLEITGFLSYQDKVEIDFTRFNLACITGANGAGKSSLLDAITWVLFGQARKNNDAILNSKAKMAEVVLDFYYEQNLYRVQRSKPRDKTSKLDFYIQAADGGWRSLTEAKIGETEDRIAATLRLDYDTFINASFFLQGKADQFAQQRPGDRKRILSTILGLEIWEQYREAAAERRKKVEGEVRTIQGFLVEIDRELAEEPERVRALTQCQSSLQQAVATRQAQENTVAAIRSLKAAIEEQHRNVLRLEKEAIRAAGRLSDLENKISNCREELDGFGSLLAEESEIRAAHTAWKSAQSELERWDTLERSYNQLNGQRTPHLVAVESERSAMERDLSFLLAQQETQEHNSTRILEIKNSLQGAHQRSAELQASLARRMELPNLLEIVVQRISDLNSEKSNLNARMAEFKNQINDLSAASGATCPLCGQPLTPEERQRHLEELQAQGQISGDRHRAITNFELPAALQDRKKLQDEQTALDRNHQELLKLQAQIISLEQNLSELQNLQAEWQQSGAPRLAEISANLANGIYAAQARAALQELDTQIDALEYDSQAHQSARLAELNGRTSEDRLREVENAQAAQQPLQRQLAELIASLPTAQTEAESNQVEFERAQSKLQSLTGGQSNLEAAESRLFELQEDEHRLRKQEGEFQQRVKVLEIGRKRKKDYIDQQTSLNLQITRLKQLERAFSKDGVPAILIDQALPEIEAQANDILDRISGGSMSVRFDTQADYKDRKREDKKETLDIIISDAAGSREYELFSGGEAFRVNFAIRMALSRVLAQRAGARLQTLVIDEGFGSQDAEGRQRLIEAINQVRPEFACILVITHLEEMKDAFPARIEVEKTPHGSRATVVSA